jgi:hypothetical protein
MLAGSAALIGAAPHSTSAAEVGVPDGAVRVEAQTGSIGPGRMVDLESSERPFIPTADQLVARERAMAGLATHLAPPLGRHTSSADVSVSGGPQTNASVRQAPNDFVFLRAASLVNSTCPGCGQSSVNEPMVANSGKVVVETSNWNIAYTMNASTPSISWLNLNPYALSSGFCCDQQVVYDPGRDVYLLLQLDYAGEGNAHNGLALAEHTPLFIIR